MAVKKAIKMVPIAQQIYEIEETQVEDVEFKLFDIEQITLGESFKIAISLHVSKDIARCHYRRLYNIITLSYMSEHVHV